jgi:alpha/beta superfamily hydrolase
MDTKVGFNTGELEGAICKMSNTRGVVVTHPHPLYGGNMDNPVVTTIAEAYQKLGWTSLRFNFRGVGDSRGNYDDGHGEQDDLQAAVGYLRSLGIQQIDLAGYSFGAWVISHWAQGKEIPEQRILLVSPPVAFMDFSGVASIPGLAGVITGEQDDIAPANAVASELKRWNPDIDLHALPKVDHFYAGRLDVLSAAIGNILKNHE